MAGFMFFSFCRWISLHLSSQRALTSLLLEGTTGSRFTCFSLFVTALAFLSVAAGIVAPRRTSLAAELLGPRPRPRPRAPTTRSPRRACVRAQSSSSSSPRRRGEGRGRHAQGEEVLHQDRRKSERARGREGERGRHAQGERGGESGVPQRSQESGGRKRESERGSERGRARERGSPLRRNLTGLLSSQHFLTKPKTSQHLLTD